MATGSTVLDVRTGGRPAGGRLGLWHVIRSKSRQEKQLAEVLTGRGGCEVFLPLVARTRFYGHRKRVSHVPLFPGYLFLHGPEEAVYAALDSGRAVDRLRVADQAGLAAELDSIQAALAAGAVFLEHNYLARGRRVRVRSGPLMGVEGIVERRPRPTRLVLQIETLGQATSLEVDADLLEPAD